jgi:hypothetical protein
MQVAKPVPAPGQLLVHNLKHAENVKVEGKSFKLREYCECKRLARFAEAAVKP